MDSNALVLSWAREAGCFREVAALHSDHLRQVPLYVQHFMYVCVCVCISVISATRMISASNVRVY